MAENLTLEQLNQNFETLTEQVATKAAAVVVDKQIDSKLVVEKEVIKSEVLKGIDEKIKAGVGNLGDSVSKNTTDITKMSTKVTAIENDRPVIINDAANAAAAKIVDGAPETLDTLNELAKALGDDVNFSTTVTNKLSEIETLTNTNKTSIDGNTTSLTTLEQEIATTKTSVSTHGTKITNLEKASTDASSKISTLETTSGEHTTKITNIETQLSDFDVDFSSVEENIVFKINSDVFNKDFSDKTFINDPDGFLDDTHMPVSTTIKKNIIFANRIKTNDDVFYMLAIKPDFQYRVKIGDKIELISDKQGSKFIFEVTHKADLLDSKNVVRSVDERQTITKGALVNGFVDYVGGVLISGEIVERSDTYNKLNMFKGFTPKYPISPQDLNLGDIFTVGKIERNLDERKFTVKNIAEPVDDYDALHKKYGKDNFQFKYFEKLETVAPDNTYNFSPGQKLLNISTDKSFLDLGDVNNNLIFNSNGTKMMRTEDSMMIGTKNSNMIGTNNLILSSENSTIGKLSDESNVDSYENEEVNNSLLINSISINLRQGSRLFAIGSQNGNIEANNSFLLRTSSSHIQNNANNSYMIGSYRSNISGGNYATIANGENCNLTTSNYSSIYNARMSNMTNSSYSSIVNGQNITLNNCDNVLATGFNPIASDSKNSHFIVGNGDSSRSKTAFAVLKSGELKIPLNSGNGKMLVSDNDGVATWKQHPSENVFNITNASNNATLNTENSYNCKIDTTGTALILNLTRPTKTSASGNIRFENKNSSDVCVFTLACSGVSVEYMESASNIEIAASSKSVISWWYDGTTIFVTAGHNYGTDA